MHTRAIYARAYNVTILFVIGLIAAAPVPDTVRKQLDNEASAYVLEPDYPKFLRTVEEWKKLPLGHRAQLIESLARHLNSTQKPGVVNPDDLIIPYRIKTKDLKFYGHGHLVMQDLFIVGGKAAWAIEQLTGVDTWLPEINEGQTKEERAKRVEVISGYAASFQQVVAYLLESDYPTLDNTIKKWQGRPASDRLRLVELLAGHLTSAEKPGLKNHVGNVKIGYRLKTGDMQPGSFKKSTEQDLYIFGGKAAFAIGELIHPIPFRDFPEITEGQSEDERERQAILIRMCVAAYKSGVLQGLAPNAPVPK